MPSRIHTFFINNFLIFLYLSKTTSPGFSWNIFSLVAGLVLCFGFWTRIMLITHGFFSYYWESLTQSQGLLSFSYCYWRVWEGGRDTRRWEGTAESNWPKGHPIPYVAMQNKKAGERAHTAWGLARHQSVGSKQLYSVSLLLSILIITINIWNHNTTSKSCLIWGY